MSSDPREPAGVTLQAEQEATPARRAAMQAHREGALLCARNHAPLRPRYVEDLQGVIVRED